MRRPPRPRHELALLILAAVAAFGGVLVMHDPDMSPEQVHIASAALKRHQGDLFPHDPVYGHEHLWRLHTPVFQSLLELALVPTGYADMSLPFRLLGGAVILLYLCSMYALVQRQCRSWSVSAFVAVLSTTVTYTLGNAFWGVGTLASISPAGICVGFTPLVVLGFLGGDEPAARRERQWRLVIVFGCIGLLGNLHLATAINLTIILLVAHLARRRLRPQSWSTAAACLLAAVVGSLPYWGYFLALRSMAGEAGAAGYEQARSALAAADMELLYPELLKQLLDWLIYAAALLVPALVVLIRAERFRLRNASVWVAMTAAGLTLALGVHGLCQLYAWTQDRPPILLFTRSSALVMLPLYVLLAQALTNLFRIVRTHRWLVRWVCAAALAAWMAPSENLQVARHWAYDAATSFVRPADRPARVRELDERKQARRELAAAGRYIRMHAPTGAVLVTDQAEMRLLARRSLVAERSDVGYYYALAPSRLDEWRRRLAAQTAILALPPRPEEMDRFRRALASESDAPRDVPWLVLLPARLHSPEAEPWEVRNDSWGRFFRVYRIPPEGEAPAPRPVPHEGTARLKPEAPRRR